MKKNLYLFCLLLLLCVSQINAKNFVIVSSNHPPYNYVENNQTVGINIDIVREALKRMNHTFTFEFLPWQSSLFKTKYGQADAIVNASYRKSRTRYLHYPEHEVFNQNWYAFKLKNSNVTLDENFSNANKLTVGIMQNFVYGGKIQKAIKSKLFKNIVYFQNDVSMLKNLYEKKIDMFIGNKVTISLTNKQQDNQYPTSIVKITGTNEEYLLSSDKTYLAFSKKTIPLSMVEEFSEILLKMENDGSLENIVKKYY